MEKIVIKRTRIDMRQAAWNHARPDHNFAPCTRSYILDQDRVHDFRTGLEAKPKAVLNGDLDQFTLAGDR